MLQKMNEYIKGWVAGAIVALIGATFVLWGVSSYIGGSKGADAPVAKVNGYKITEQAFQKEYREVKNQYLQRSGLSVLPADAVDQLKQYILQRMIAQRALLQSAKSNRFAVSVQQVQALMMHDSAFQVNGQFSMQRMRAVMYQRGMRSLGEFFSQLQDEVLVSQVSGGIGITNFILPDEWKSAYGLMNQTREVGYFAMPLSSFQPKAKISDQAVETEYKNNLKRYVAPMKASFNYLVLDPHVVAKSIVVSDQEITQYYQDHQSNYSSPKRWKVTVVTVPPAKKVTDDSTAQAVKQAKQFIVAAKQDKNLSALAERMGMTITTPTLSASNSVVPVSVLNTLTVGKLSQPIATPQGIIVVRVDQVDQASTQSLSSVRAKIIAMLTSQKLERVMAQQTKQLSQLTYTDPNSLSSAAKALKLSVQTSDLMTENGLSDGLFADKAVLQVAFGDEVMEQSYNSRPIALKDGSVVVLRRHTMEKSHQLPLKSVASEIKQRLVKNKAEELAGVQAYAIQKALQSGVSVKSLSEQYQLTWKQVADLSRDNNTLPSVFTQAVFSTPVSKKQPSAVNTVLVDDKTYYVFKISDWSNPSVKSASKKEESALKQHLLDASSQMDYAVYVSGVRDQAKVKIFQSALSDVK